MGLFFKKNEIRDELEALVKEEKKGNQALNNYITLFYQENYWERLIPRKKKPVPPPPPTPEEEQPEQPERPESPEEN
jgi:hypothetical protein